MFTCFQFLLVVLFVDDAQGYIHSTLENINQTILTANRDSLALVLWSKDASIALNPDKFQALIIGSRHNLRKMKNMTVHPIIVDGVVVSNY